MALTFKRNEIPPPHVNWSDPIIGREFAICSAKGMAFSWGPLFPGFSHFCGSHLDSHCEGTLPSKFSGIPLKPHLPPSRLSEPQMMPSRSSFFCQLSASPPYLRPLRQGLFLLTGLLWNRVYTTQASHWEHEVCISPKKTTYL